MVKSNFFVGIGAQKCASTWLYDILRDHSDVALSSRKEIDFFSFHYGKGFQWYSRSFPQDLAGRVWGEISPSYFFELGVPERVRLFEPKTKILVSLRDPVERAISNHRHEVRLGHFMGPDLSFEAGMRNNPLYVEQSRYGTHLTRWHGVFPKDQILIVFQDEIDREPRSVAQQVYRFMGVDPDHVSGALGARSNVSHLYRSHGLEYIRKSARRVFHQLGIDGLWRKAQRVGMQRVYRQMNRLPTEAYIPPVRRETIVELRAMFDDEIRMVEAMTGRSLAHWRESREPHSRRRIVLGREQGPNEPQGG